MLLTSKGTHAHMQIQAHTQFSNSKQLFVLQTKVIHHLPCTQDVQIFPPHSPTLQIACLAQLSEAL